MVWRALGEAGDLNSINLEFGRLGDALEGISNYEVITPQWTAASSAPSIGNGTLTGIFLEISDLRWLQVQLVAGSTTAFGTGAWRFQPPADKTRPAVGNWVGSVWGLDSGTAFRTGVARILDTEEYFQIYSDAGTVPWQSSTPHTWATSDELNFSIMYRIKLFDV